MKMTITRYGSRSLLAPNIAAAFCVLISLSCFAQSPGTYPARAVRMIVPFPPGGAVDLLARPLAQKLSERLGQNVVVDNRGGATGIIGADLAAKAAPDGYTILVDNVTGHAINPALVRTLPFNTLRDFAPVTLLGWVTNVILVHPSLPVKNVKELIALAKMQPRKLSYAHFGIGGTSHLAGELMKIMTGIDIIDVPYKGGGPAMADLLGGQIPINFATVSTALGPIRSGRVRALAVTGIKRSAAIPDIPTVAESGLRGYDVNNWYGLLSPAATPRDIVARLHDETIKAIQTRDLFERLSAQGYDLQTSTREEFAQHLRAETLKWEKVIMSSGIKIE